MKTLTEQNHGSNQLLNVSEQFKIELTSNPATGYIWEITSIEGDRLKLISEDQVRYTSEKIGLGSLMTFVFVALIPGQTALELIYRRTWDPNSVLNRFFIQIEVE